MRVLRLFLLRGRGLRAYVATIRAADEGHIGLARRVRAAVTGTGYVLVRGPSAVPSDALGSGPALKHPVQLSVEQRPRRCCGLGESLDILCHLVDLKRSLVARHEAKRDARELKRYGLLALQLQ